MKQAYLFSCLSALALFLLAASNSQAQTFLLKIEADTSQERTQIVESGIAIESINEKTVWGVASSRQAIQKLQDADFNILERHAPELPNRVSQQENEEAEFPEGHEKYHTVAEVKEKLQSLAQNHQDVARLKTIGHSVEGREILALHINSSKQALKTGTSQKGGAVFIGNHHAREHISVEVPLLLAEHLLENRNKPRIQKLIANRDTWIIPQLNPDGARYDIISGEYRHWRKNRAENHDGSYGVDLNRNYGFHWGESGASANPSSQTYHGPSAFSEPETQAIRAFIEGHSNINVLLSFHNYSELILYPWGHRNQAIQDSEDRKVFQTMANTMAQWNDYTPQQSSDLYVASGDTTDWAYARHDIFAFTFELSPDGGPFGGGTFYLDDDKIDDVFQDNLKPCLYMLSKAKDPYQVIGPNLLVSKFFRL